jgi:transcriptional regulator with XRE-family HTH domain
MSSPRSQKGAIVPREIRPAGDSAPLLRRFGANLRTCRERVGLSPEELAARAGMGLELLIEFEEAGGAIPGIGLFMRLADTLGCRPSELVAGVVWVPYEVVEREGTFEVVEDAGLVDEIAVLRGSRGKGPAADAK